jgi:hypothetical protein
MGCGVSAATNHALPVHPDKEAAKATMLNGGFIGG